MRADPWRWLSALTGAALAACDCSWLAVREPPRLAVLFAPLVSARLSELAAEYAESAELCAEPAERCVSPPPPPLRSFAGRAERAERAARADGASSSVCRERSLA